MTGVDNRDPFTSRIHVRGSPHRSQRLTPARTPRFGFGWFSETKTARTITAQTTRQDPVADTALTATRDGLDLTHVGHRARQRCS